MGKPEREGIWSWSWSWRAEESVIGKQVLTEVASMERGRRTYVGPGKGFQKPGVGERAGGQCLCILIV